MTVLLSLILLLLAVQLVLHFTGRFPGAGLDIERLSMAFRRELAGQRAEILQHLHSLKSDVDALSRECAGENHDVLLNQVEYMIALLENSQLTTRRRGPKKVTQDDPVAVLQSETEEMEEIFRCGVAGKSLLRKRQIALFPAEDLAEDSVKGFQETPDTVEFESVPAADFDPDIDPPYDPDALAGQGH